MKKEKLWYGVFLGATFITGMIGASTNNQIKAKGYLEQSAIESNEILNRKSWTANYSTNGKKTTYYNGSSIEEEIYEEFNYIEKEYSDGTIEIIIQISEPQSNCRYSIGSIKFNDNLYSLDKKSKWNINTVESYDNDNNVVIDFIKETGYYFHSGEILSITLTPLKDERVKTTIEAFSQTFEVGDIQQEKVLQGDINKDSLVNSEDAALILTYSADVGSGIYSGTITDWYNERSN